MPYVPLHRWLAALSFALISLWAQAQPLYLVTRPEDDANAATYAGTFRWAIDQINGDEAYVSYTIQFAPNVTTTTLLAALPTIHKHVTLKGASSLCPATTQGGTIIDLNRITNLHFGMPPTVEDLVVKNTVTTGEGAVWIDATDEGFTTKFTRCRFEQCAGGAIQVYNGHLGSGSASLTDCFLVNNESNNTTYAGINMTIKTLLIDRCTFENNLMRCDNGCQPAGENILFYHQTGAQVTIRNTTFIGGNNGSYVKGTYMSGEGRLQLEHCSFGLLSSTLIDGYSVYAISYPGGQTTIRNCLLATGNAINFPPQGNPEGNETIISLGGNVSTGTDGYHLNQPTDKNSQILSLLPLAAAASECIPTLALNAPNPAVDAGVTTVLLTDARGQQRTSGAKPDAGAYEYQQILTLRSGDWNDASLWDNGRVPVSSDNVTIAPGHTVTLSTTGFARHLKLDGRLIYVSGGRLVLSN